MKPALRKVLLCVLFLLAPPALADDGFGVLMGTVMDGESRSVIEGVVVTATSPSLMGERTVVTDENGLYWFPQLPAGLYTLRFEAVPFRPDARDVYVRINTTYRLNVELMPEGMTECVRIVGGSASVPWNPGRIRAGSRSAYSDVVSYTPASPYALAQMPGQYGSGTRVAPPRSGTTEKAFLEMYFQGYGVNPTVETEEERFSTFSVDVDTASYSLARGYLERGVLPDERAVRVEEFVNAFDYGYESGPDVPFAVHVEGFPSPNRPGYHVLHVGLKAREVPRAQRKPSHLIFTIDTSGSMDDPKKLAVVKQALRLLVDALDERDRVSIVTYGPSAWLVLPPTSVLRREVLLSTIDGLAAEGSTNVQAGLDLAYSLASSHMLEGGINRVILCSDGVANNGVTDADGIWARVKDSAARGITLSTVGFGMGHYNDVLLERLSHVGEGNYAYVDRLDEARRIFVQNLTGTFQVVARDVKVQLEFDPRAIARYRLVGYENRILGKEQFTDDAVDAGEVGSGHTVTAIYEVKTRGEWTGGDFATLRLRYKAPEGGSSQEVVKALPSRVLRASYASAAPPTRLSYVAAAFAEKLRASYWMRPLTWEQLSTLFEGVGEPLRNRPEVAELGSLIRKSASLDQRTDRFETIAPVRTMDFDRVPRIE
ncbi:von Willebrand factor type A domain-containing protein [Myxococcus sp. RHSTA-1-4]|uniref:YfbK domain-containing protein n=1 Tax=Myxococcus sp. RHSTA-1-4 TaxID=2874601 RepID=UPI001CBBFB6F|nr:von Willebrand factor type A domain-containing protein [Myxococcus sp. RHSTA-1-4]MBZ4416041.1 von Willebrand factor type A domain-containing protein [Myxococcus sp. RHSTA-1-4]